MQADIWGDGYFVNMDRIQGEQIFCEDGTDVWGTDIL